MKKLFVFLVVTTAALTAGYGQFKRHYWLNPQSVNYTLSYPTSNGEWMLAAARQERGTTMKNTIAVFRVDNSYNILDTRIIGLPWANVEEQFDPNVDFDIHCIVESHNPNGYYIICGTIRRGADANVAGVVVVTDAGLNPLSIREYPEVSHFYSVYAQDNFYYVCGQRHDRHGITLRGDVVSFQPNEQAYVTQQQWDYQKIRVVNSPGSGEIKISGTGISEDGDQTLGYTIFYAQAGNFAPMPNLNPIPVPNPIASWQFSPVNHHGIGSKVVIANHPGGAGGQGVVLAVSDATNIYTYLFFQHPAPSHAFRVPCHGGVLEDVECAGPGGGTSLSQIAWVGNLLQTAAQRRAYYLHTNLTPTYPPFPSSPATFTYFHPFATTGAAYYSLHKVHFHRDQWNPISPGDLEFHAGGYYRHQDGNKTTFAVTPALIDEDENECITREEVDIEDLDMPLLHPLNLIEMEAKVINLPTFSKKYHFCEMDCYGESDCGNR